MSQATTVPEVPTAPPAQQTEEQLAEQREVAMKDAAKLLNSMARAYARGERGLLAAAVEAGEYADSYVKARLALGDKRSAAVQAVEGKLAEVSGELVKANVLIGAYHAYRLLNPGDACVFTLSHYREAFTLLVVRLDKDTPQETWSLLPGFEDQCKAAYTELSTGKLSKTACIDRCRKLVREYDAEQAKAQASDLQTRAEKAQDAANKAATPEAKAQLQATADATKKAADVATNKAADAQLLAANPEMPKQTRKSPDQPVEKPLSCVDVARAASSAKDLGALLADMIHQSGKDAADVVEHLAACLDWNPRMGTGLIKGLARSESPSTAFAMHKMLCAVLPSSKPIVNAQPVNGQPVAA
jgi:hypothetical protein